jgi:hypothetical protein
MPTFRVDIRGIQTREQHDAVSAAVQSALLRNIAKLDLARGVEAVRIDTKCTCAGTMGSGGSGGIASAIESADFTPLHLEYTRIRLTEDQLGKVEFRLSDVHLSSDQLAAIERDIQVAVLPHLGAIDFGSGQVGVMIPYLSKTQDSVGIVFGPVDQETLYQQQLMRSDG